ncbi:hypothetical protein D3C81_1094190 [compost metagenome]
MREIAGAVALGDDPGQLPAHAEIPRQCFGLGFPAGGVQVAVGAEQHLLARSGDAARGQLARGDRRLAHQPVMHADHQRRGGVDGHRVRLGHGARDALGVLELLLGQSQHLAGRRDRAKDIVAATVVVLDRAADELVGRAQADQDFLADCQRCEEFLACHVLSQARRGQEGGDNVLADVPGLFMEIAAIHGPRHRPDGQCRLRGGDLAAIKGQHGFRLATFVLHQFDDRRYAVHRRAADGHGHGIQQRMPGMPEHVCRQVLVLRLQCHAAQGGHWVFGILAWKSCHGRVLGLGCPSQGRPPVHPGAAHGRASSLDGR